MNKKTLRQELLAWAANMPISKFTLFIVRQHGTMDKVLPDEDGDSISEVQSYKLTHFDTLQVYVPAGSDPSDIIRGLKKVIARIETNPDKLSDDWGYDEELLEGEKTVIEPERGVDTSFVEREDNPVKDSEEDTAYEEDKRYLDNYLANHLEKISQLLKAIENARVNDDVKAMRKAELAIMEYTHHPLLNYDLPF